MVFITADWNGGINLILMNSLMKQQSSSHLPRSIQDQLQRFQTLLFKEDVHLEEPGDCLRATRPNMSMCCTSHQLLFSVHAPRRWRHIISSRGHRRGEDTDFPLGPSQRWCQVTLFLLCYQQKTCLTCTYRSCVCLTLSLVQSFCTRKRGQKWIWGLTVCKQGSPSLSVLLLNNFIPASRHPTPLSDWPMCYLFLFYYGLFEEKYIKYFSRSEHSYDFPLRPHILQMSAA